jgi:hypothetical protein
MEKRIVQVMVEHWKWLKLPNSRGIGGKVEHLPTTYEHLEVVLDWTLIAERYGKEAYQKESKTVLKHDGLIRVKALDYNHQLRMEVHREAIRNLIEEYIIMGGKMEDLDVR